MDRTVVSGGLSIEDVKVVATTLKMGKGGGLSIKDVEVVATTLEMGRGKGDCVLWQEVLHYILLALLGLVPVGPKMDDGWFRPNFVMAHQIYGNLLGEQIRLSIVDMVEEAKVAGSYLWDYPKHTRLYRVLQRTISLSILYLLPISC